jgi:hypothetical protein
MNQTGNSKEAHAVSGAGEPDAKTRIIVLGGGFGGPPGRATLRSSERVRTV